MKSLSFIILCGGSGTRVKDLLGDLPKVLTPRGGKPHLLYSYFQIKSCFPGAKIYLATGFGGEKIANFVNKEDLEVIISHERKPVGTGGAVLKCMRENMLTEAVVINGDTIYSALPSIDEIKALQKETVFLSFKKDRVRFGAVDIDEDMTVSLLPNGSLNPGFVNCGIYYVTEKLISLHKENSFLSFEHEMINTKDFEFKVINLDFQDFGVPEDIVQFTDIRNV
jgi:NDP-sugar pyrophosphorylase family protein